MKISLSVDCRYKGKKGQSRVSSLCYGGKTGQAPVYSPVETWKCSEISLSVKCRYKGEKGPTTGLLRPGRRQRRPATPLFPISKYTPLDGSTRGNRAKHESRPYATAGKTGQAPSLSPVETCEISEISPSVKCRYKGEKLPTTDLLRPGRRERRPATALFLISMYTPLDGCTGERGPSTDVLSTATPREIRAWHLSPCRANIGSTGERGPAADFSRPGGRERVPGADLLSTARPREIRAWHSLSRWRSRESARRGFFSTATPREIRAWHSLSTATPREIRAHPLFPL